MSYQSEVLADAPQGYWRLGESSGSVLVDSSGQAHSGAYTGVITHAAGLLTSSYDQCVVLTGQYANIPHGAWMDTAAFTYEAWINPNGVAGTQDVLTRDHAGGTGSTRVAGLAIAGNKVYGIVFTSTSTYECYGKTALVAGSTYHIAMRYDGATVKVYLNGVEDGSVATAGVIHSAITDLALGRTAPGGYNGFYFQGKVDEAAYYNYALSPQRLAAHYAAGTAPLTNEAKLAGTLPMPVMSAHASVAAAGHLTGQLPTLVLDASAAFPTQLALASELPAMTGQVDLSYTDPASAWPGPEIVLDDFTFTSAPVYSGGLGVGRGAWWHYMAPDDPDTLEFSLLDTDPDDPLAPPSQAQVAIYTGTSVDELDLVVQGPAVGVQLVPVAGTTYYVEATLPADAPDETYQLFVGPPAGDESYEMDLEVLSGPLRAAPTSVTVTVDGGLPNDDVEFQVDGVLTGDTATLDDSGSLDATSINVADGYGKGDHIVSVHSTTSTLAGEGTFTLQRGPYAALQVVGVDSRAIDIPEANTASGVRRWVLQDLMAGGLGSWVMLRNPSSMSAPEYKRTLTQVHTTAIDEGQYHLASVGHAAVEWTFAGYVDTELEQQKLEAFKDLKRRFYVIDHRSRAWIVTFTGVEITPRKRQPKDDGTFNDWAADYTVSALIYDQNWTEPT